MGVIGGEREGRLLVSKCSTDNDLRRAGFHTIPPITFLQYWLFTDLKNQKQGSLSTRTDMFNKRLHHKSNSLSMHAPSLAEGWVISFWMTDTSQGYKKWRYEVHSGSLLLWPFLVVSLLLVNAFGHTTVNNKLALRREPNLTRR